MKDTRKKILGVKERNNVILLEKPFPLIGHIGFGIIDRGLNNIQVRISSMCPLACIFCSVDAGRTTRRKKEFIVDDVDWTMHWIEKTISYKGEIHVLYDAAGDPLTNPKIVDFIEKTRRLNKILTISLETRFHPPDKKLAIKLDRAGLDRLNVSIDAIDTHLARRLTNTPSYDVKKIMKLLEYIHNNTNIDIHITPLWIPGINDEEIEKIIEWVKSAGFGKKWPPLGIQKYVAHKHGRKIPGIKEWSWDYFFKKLRSLEEKYKIKLVLSQDDFDVHNAVRVPIPYRKGDVLKLFVYTQAWWNNEYICTTHKKDWVITLISRKTDYESGDIVIAKIIRDKDGILLAVPV